MHRWNRITMDWGTLGLSGLETTIPVVDPKGKIEEGKHQTLQGFRAVSLPDRRGKIEVKMRPSINLLYSGEHHILGCFANLEQGLRFGEKITFSRTSWGDGAWPPLIIEFELTNGESFCDTAIALAREILKRAGVRDEKNYSLGHFTLEQATFVKFENTWISFVRWLRIQHQLPICYVGDDEKIPLVEAA